MVFLVAILTAGLSIAVCAQQERIVDKPVIPIGGTFTVTCDANRFPPGTIPSDVTYIQDVGIERDVGNEIKKVLAFYNPLAPPSFQTVYQSFPVGRNWLLETSGGLGPGDLPTNNRATIKVVLTVKDAECSDAGLYRCKATYFIPNGAPVSVEHSQYLNASTEAPALTLDHHSGNAPDFSTNTKGQRVKLTCKFEGPGGLMLSWLTGPIGGNTHMPYPSDDHIQTVTPAPHKGSVGCGAYESTLTLNVPALGTVYVCAVMDSEGEVSRDSFRIVVKPEPRSTATALEQGFVRSVFLVNSAMFHWALFL